ncbi:MAG: DUF1501 domain-containing protein [Gemmataceae bacterium]|nr:DUF1501 domain-containing protein [Gemmataceae bacterium]
MLRIGPTSSRRGFLQVATAGMLAGASRIGAEIEATKSGHSVIFVFCHGGPSQLETFDPKPDAPSDIKTVVGTIPTTIPGQRFGEHFPLLANRAGRILNVRSYIPGDANHDLKPLVCKDSGMANLGSIYASVSGIQTGDGLPANVFLHPESVGEKRANPFMGPELVGVTGGFPKSTTPFVPGGAGNLLKDMKLKLSADKLTERRALLTALDNLKLRLDSEPGEGMRDRALRLLLGGVGDAFNLKNESAKVLERYDTSALVSESSIPTKWNNHNFYKEHVRSLGKLMLMARRLVERGTGFVAVNTAFVWDNHSDVNNAPMKDAMPWLAPVLDKALSALLDDLFERGLSEKVLVVVCGEIGRTPKVNAQGGRDHWGNLGPLLMAGGPITTGGVYGQSSRDGANPTAMPVTIPNVLGTIFGHLWDLPKLRLRTDLGRDISRITGYEGLST